CDHGRLRVRLRHLQPAGGAGLRLRRPAGARGGGALMTSVAPPTAIEEARAGDDAGMGESEWRQVWRRLRRKRLAMISLVVIAVIYGVGILAPVLAPYRWTE